MENITLLLGAIIVFTVVAGTLLLYKGRIRDYQEIRENPSLLPFKHRYMSMGKILLISGLLSLVFWSYLILIHRSTPEQFDPLLVFVLLIISFMTALTTLMYGINIFLHITTEVSHPQTRPSKLAHWLSLIMKAATGTLALLLFVLAIITIASISIPCEPNSWWCPSDVFDEVYPLLEEIAALFGF